MIPPSSLGVIASCTIAAATWSGVAFGACDLTCAECDPQLDLCLSCLPGYEINDVSSCVPALEEILITDTYPPEDDREVLFLNEALHHRVTVSSAGLAQLTIHAARLEGPAAKWFTYSLGDGLDGACGSLPSVIEPGGNCFIRVESVFDDENPDSWRSASLILSFSEEGPPEVTIELSSVWHASELMGVGGCFARMLGGSMWCHHGTGVIPCSAEPKR